MHGYNVEKHILEVRYNFHTQQLPHIEISDSKGWYHNLTYDNKIWEINAKQFNAFQKTPK